MDPLNAYASVVVPIIWLACVYNHLFSSGLNQALAVRMNKVESRMYEALEPVYIALQRNRDGVENLEALMVDVAEKLDGLKESTVMLLCV